MIKNKIITCTIRNCPRCDKCEGDDKCFEQLYKINYDNVIQHHRCKYGCELKTCPLCYAKCTTSYLKKHGGYCRLCSEYVLKSQLIECSRCHDEYFSYNNDFGFCQDCQNDIFNSFQDIFKYNYSQLNFTRFKELVSKFNRK